MTVETMDSAAAVAAMGKLYGKTDQQLFEESWREFKRQHALDFQAYSRTHQRDRWSMYDCLKRQWADANSDLAEKFYSKAAHRIAEALRL